MPGEPSYSARWSVMTGANPTFSGTSVRHPYTGDTIRSRRQILKSPQMRGTRATVTAQTQWGPIDVQGDLTADASPALLGFHLVQAMGGGTATAPAMADLVPEWSIMADRGTGGYTHGDCYKFLALKTNRLQLAARAGGLVGMTVSVFGKTESGLQTFAGAALANTRAEEPYTASMVDLEIDAAGGFNVKILDWTLTLDNGLTQRFANSDTCDAILEGDRMVTLAGNVALEADLIGDVYDSMGRDGFSGSLTLTNSTVSTVFTFANIQFNKETITRQGNEFILPLNCEIRGTSSNEFTVTNDITP